MKLIFIALALFGATVCAQAPIGDRSFPRPPHPPPFNPYPSHPPLTFKQRFRREADPQGSLSFSGTKPLSGPDRRPSLNLDYNHRIHDNGRSTIDLYGGANKLPGQPIRPEFGIKAERNFGKNGFINGNFGASPGNRGRLTPQFGLNAGFRFKREANPQGSFSLTGIKPLSGPDRRPSVNIDYNHRIVDNGRSTVDLYGGANKLPGQPIRPEFGFKAERNFGKNGFINGNFGASPGNRGRLTPQFGLNAGFRFRRDVEEVESHLDEEEQDEIPILEVPEEERPAPQIPDERQTIEEVEAANELFH